LIRSLGSISYNINLMILRFIIFVTFLVTSGLAAQNNIQDLWITADRLVAQAYEELMPELLPDEFRNIAKTYLQIKNNYERNTTTDRLTEDLRALNIAIVNEINNLSQIRSQIVDVIQARDQAIRSGVNDYNIEAFSLAEELLPTIGRDLRRGNQASLNTNKIEAIRLYDIAELETIHLTVLSQGTTLLEQAVSSGVGILAPKTLSEARNLLGQAATILSNNRSFLSEARLKHDDAITHISLAINLSRQIQLMRAQQLTEEDLIISLSQPISQIADYLMLESDAFSDPNLVALSIIQSVEELRLTNLSQLNTVNNQHLQLSRLEDQITDISSRMIASQNEKDELILELERATAATRKFNQIEQIFEGGQAVIMRENNDILIRLGTITFAVGADDISNSGSPIFQKIIDAISLFPDAIVLIEGHTDSIGDYDSNLNLSQLRAASVESLLVNRYGLPPYQVTSIGYGELRPIANEETLDGREQNRRIEIRIALEP
jgi:OOP family OmpA-OmpF porin